MRLAAEQAAAIKSGVVGAFGAESRVWLFGSRLRDDLLGGDIDLYVELPAQTEHVFARTVRLNGSLQMALGEQRIDIVTHLAGSPEPGDRRAGSGRGIAGRRDPAPFRARPARPGLAHRLESFVGKFSRMQDKLVDKLIPLLHAVGEQPGAGIDNLNRIERWGYLSDVPRWLGMRRLRNRLVHEYLEHSVGLAEALGEAQAFSLIMRETHGALREFARQRLPLPLTATTNEATHV